MNAATSPSSRWSLLAGNSPLRVTRYDRVASMLVTLLVLVGLATLLLFCVWLTTVIVFRNVPPSYSWTSYSAAVDGPQGLPLEAEPPPIEETSITWETPLLSAALDPVTELASQLAAGQPSAPIAGIGSGPPAGSRDAGPDVIPPWERWEIRYSSSDLRLYAQQLDHFGIELGALGGSRQVDYAYNLSENPPATRHGAPRDEKRIYMTWHQGKLREFDEVLFSRAGIVVRDRIIMQFIPESMDRQLHELEFAAAAGRPPEQWLRTTFGVRPDGGGFEFYVIEQTFRP